VPPPLRLSSTDGVDVAAYDLGGDGSPLLLVHATGFHGRVLTPLAAGLQDRFHCWTFDERGHGDSSRPPSGSFDWHGFGDDTLAAVDGLGLERPFGVCHSAGGAALLMAEQARPGTFRALYLYEPVVIPVDPPIGPQDDNPLAIGARRRREVFPSRDEAYANFAAKAPFQVLRHDALRAYVDHGFVDQPDGSVRLKCQRDDEAETYRMGSAHDAFGRAGLVRCPVTVACGAETDALGAPVAAQLADALPAARLDVLPGLGHFGPLQDPDAVAASILRFASPIAVTPRA